MLKVELLKLVAENKKIFEPYHIDRIVAQLGHAVLRLPLYRCELNPIEFIKDKVAKLTPEGIEKASS